MSRVLYDKSFGKLRIYLTRNTALYGCLIFPSTVIAFVLFIAYAFVDARHQNYYGEGRSVYNKEYPLPMLLRLDWDTSARIMISLAPPEGSVSSLKWGQDYLIAKFIKHNKETGIDNFYPYCLYDFRNLTIYVIKDLRVLEDHLKRIAGPECRADFLDLPQARLQREKDLGFRFTKRRLENYNKACNALQNIRYAVCNFKNTNARLPKSLEELLSFQGEKRSQNGYFTDIIEKQDRNGYTFRYRLLEDGIHYEMWAEGPPGTQIIKYPAEFCSDLNVSWKVVYLPRKDPENEKPRQ